MMDPGELIAIDFIIKKIQRLIIDLERVSEFKVDVK